MVAKKKIYTWVTDTASVLHFNTILPYSALDPERYECTWGGPPEDWRLQKYDVIIGQRLADYQPLWHDICRDPDTLAVYSIDDDLTNVDPENTVVYRIYAPIVPGTISNITAADVVTVPTPAFAERMSQHNPNTAILPLCVPDDMVDWPRTWAPQWTVGWSGSMFKGQDWPGVTEELVQFFQQHPDAMFHTIGADYTNGMLGPHLRSDGWTDITTSYRRYDFHIGLAPLLDSFFNALKSRTKLVEYGARGIPTIASAVGEYVDWIDHGVNGFLVREPGDWLKYLNILTEDKALWQSMSDAAYAKAREARIGENIHLWQDVYDTPKSTYTALKGM